MAKTKQPEVQPTNVFRCDACKDVKEMVFEEFKHHLFTVHNLKADGLKGKKQMIMHMDFATSFSSTYKWTLENGITFHQFVELPRTKDDPMRYQAD